MTAGIKYFSDRLDLIFDQGMPTKAQILDAFNKGSNINEIESYNQAIEDAAEKIIDFYGNKGLTNTGNSIKELILKLKK